MEIVSISHSHLDVACSLDRAEAGSRVAEWKELLKDAGHRSELIPGGVRLWLFPRAATRAADLARREAACCGFLDFSLRSENDLLRLDVTSPVPEAAPTILWVTGLDEESRTDA